MSTWERGKTMKWIAETIDAHDGSVTWSDTGDNWQDMVLGALSAGAISADEAADTYINFDCDEGFAIDCDDWSFCIRPEKSRYAVIDLYSGYVFGAVYANDPCDACRIVDHREVREYGRTYREVAKADVRDNGYAVYAAPPGWNCDDGQDEATIDEVEAMPRVAFVLRESAE